MTIKEFYDGDRASAVCNTCHENLDARGLYPVEFVEASGLVNFLPLILVDKKDEMPVDEVRVKAERHDRTYHQGKGDVVIYKFDPTTE